MQDFVPSEKKSIRNISIERPQTFSSRPEESGDASPETIGVTLPPRNASPLVSTGRGSKKYLVWGGVVAAILVIFFSSSALFAGGKVTVHPKSVLVNLDHTFTASLAPVADGIGFEMVTLDKEMSKEVAATGQERVERPASGTIIVYNNFDDQIQKLITNTRFETPDGLIYRIKESINVPGKHKNEKGDMVPGSVEAEVFADSAGEKYNIGLSDFTIPGFKDKDAPRFAGFYARSKTPMTGGFAGTVKTASAADTKAAYDSLNAELKTALENEVLGAVPEGFIPVPSTVQTSYQTLPNADGATDTSVSVRVKGTASLVAVDETKLGAMVARVMVAGYDGSDVYFKDPKALVIEPTASSTKFSTLSDIEFKIQGSTNLLWKFDAEQLASDIAGKSRSAASEVIATYTGIENADLVIRPVWRLSFPSNPEKIDVLIATE
ncbi:hypothetical protein IPJ70_00910 [Candidatus Campbellbacteria bacterium]|nr:MAG: hypothetical protein IPJ70_00910 [Candidatus Campbellbacteria bacterium]